MPDHYMIALSAAELASARRELAASLALSYPDSPIRVHIATRLAAIDAELADRGVRVCSCGFATDDGHWLERQSSPVSWSGWSAAPSFQ